ncbi:hypothetical protein [Oceanicoccus sagamiensis]|uniref:Uncharacterized protein n=1 Tax=Oceanicoccus sagamiensis TaxID=716816 RepID=A0A1X9NCM7_9GAMM|nr:hypothetical protein [Oceanicoccus sagamiensis]ARN74911.1 hypothetical protein BST96_12765 [Oceanicoccus sagamiensis]
MKPDMLLLRLLLVASLLLAHSALAVDAKRMWLPKKYAAVKPKLLHAARDAESTERCNTVVAGEMIVRKNTAENYYFVITCRDSNLKTYNLTYQYPVAGTAPDLVAEQRSKEAQKKNKTVEIEETGVSGAQALQLCLNAFNKATDELDEVQVLEQPAPVELAPNYRYSLPFTAQSELGNDVLYSAHCQVESKGETQIELVLEEMGAVAICRDSLRAEAILYGRINIDTEAIESLPTEVEGGYMIELPFDVTNRIGSTIRYGSRCTIDAEGYSEVTIHLLPAGALAICKDGLLTETLLMKSVTIAEQASAEGINGNRFNFEIPFKANDPDGNQRNFKAFCEVDEEGEAYVSTEIDRDAIVAVCIGEVKRKTSKMKGVVILEDEIPALAGDEESGYVGIIPFDATNPMGKALHYQADCRVGGNGRSTIKLGARRR